MGGTITCTRGNWSGHIQDQGSERLGRWSFQTFEGKDGKQVTVINTYRVCKSKNDSGSCTIRSQQAKDLLVDTEEHLDPREEILKDLQKEINRLHEKGHMIILYGDMNEDIQQSTRISKFLRESNMKNILTQKHEGQLPRTHDRGQWCLDLLAVSNAMDSNAVRKCGYLPFYEGIATDHRAVYLDIDTKYLFTNAGIDTNKHVY